jgi:hypothetical protein
VGWASRPSKKEGRDAHPTITIKIVSYLIRDPKISLTVMVEFYSCSVGDRTSAASCNISLTGGLWESAISEVQTYAETICTD